MDIKDPNNKVIHNYHLVCLKMLGNIFQTQTGLDFIMEKEPATQLIQFCEYSLQSKNPKTVFRAAVVVFNLVLTYKRDFASINGALESYLKAVIENLGDMTESESILAVVLSEVRIIYKNGPLLNCAIENKDKLLQMHNQVRGKTQDSNVKQVIEDLYQLLGEE